MYDFSRLSLLAELILSLTLLFIWLMQRQEKHALYWGLGQISLGLITLYWQVNQPFAESPVHLLVMTGLMLGGVSGYWSGTRFFLGRPILPRKLLAILLLLGLHLRSVLRHPARIATPLWQHTGHAE